MKFVAGNIRGFSAIEAVISSVIFGVVVVMSFGAMNHSSKSFQSSITQAYLTDKGEKALRLMQEELADATQVGVQSIYINVPGKGTTEFRNALIYFQVPTRYKNSSDNKQGYSVKIAPVKIGYGPDPTFPDDVDFSLRYGWRDPFRMVPNEEDGGKMVYLQGDEFGLKTTSPDIPPEVMDSGTGRTIKGYNGYRFQLDPTVTMGKYGRNGVISEQIEDFDLDGDGAKTSVYAIGYIERFYCMGLPPLPGFPIYPVEASLARIGESTVVQPIGYPDNYITAESPQKMKSTSLFYADPNVSSRVDVCIWMIQMNEIGEPHIVRMQVTDFMRNNTKSVLSASATSTQ
jgi:hypothetical protein